MPSNAFMPVVHDFQTGVEGELERNDGALARRSGGVRQCPCICRKPCSAAGKNPTRAAFIDATWSAAQARIWAVSKSTPQRRNAMHRAFVELTLIGQRTASSSADSRNIGFNPISTFPEIVVQQTR
ncbi:MAG: hypothetical protein V9G23_12680 [Giesbergeria sp.]